VIGPPLTLRGAVLPAPSSGLVRLRRWRLRVLLPAGSSEVTENGFLGAKNGMIGQMLVLAD